MIGGKKVTVVLPAYNAAKTLRQTYAEIPFDVVDDVILIDDASTDDTVAVACELGIHTLMHRSNRGYGGNQKSCYASALASDQYDMVLASRILGRGALVGGMPRYKYVFNRMLTLVQNILMTQKLSEYHSGYRAWSRTVLEKLPLSSCSEDFVFDNQMMAQAAWFGFRIGEISCPTKYFAEASSINFRRSCTYGIGVLMTALDYRLNRWGLRRSSIFHGNEARSFDDVSLRAVLAVGRR